VPRFAQVSRDKEYFMRRIALLVLCLGATGCERYASSPFVGFGGFIADTHTINRGPNSPVGDATNMMRVRGMSPETEPLVPEPGNVWPGPMAELPTLDDLMKETPQLPPGGEMTLPPALRGSSTPPPPPPLPIPARPNFGPTPTPPAQSAPQVRTLQTPNGPATTSGGSGVQTFTDPKGGTGLLVPNGNGTSTLIAPDGTVTTVPTPK
jgi:hypothetical protein